MGKDIVNILMNRQATVVLLVSLVLLLFVNIHSLLRAQTNDLRIDFLDVGQGSATLITTPSGYEILVDTGPNKQVLRQLGHLRPMWDRTIDYVIATHPDLDHIGALPDVLERFQVTQVFSNNKPSKNGVYDAAVSQSVSQLVPTVFAKNGDQLEFNDGVVINFMYPFDRDVSDITTNNTSLVFMLEYYGHKILFTGDAESNIEKKLVERYGTQLDSDVLVVGHHGSKTSTHADFVTQVSPQYAVISSGADNRYGHPHHDTLQTLQKQRTQVLRTDQLGTISFVINSEGTYLLQ